MKKRAVKITVTVVIVICVLLLAGVILVPRAILYNTVKPYMSSMDKMPQNFSDYSISHSSDVRTVSTEYYSIEIPVGMEFDEEYESNSRSLYIDREQGEMIFIRNEPANISSIALFAPETIDYYIENDPEFDADEWDDFRECFEGFGHGIPDSGYNAYKSLYAFNGDDYSFWNLKKGQCFYVAAIAKGTIVRAYDTYFYERDDIRAVIQADVDDDEVTFHVSMFLTDDLNTEYSFDLFVDSFDTAAAVLNSVEFIGDERQNTV